MNVVNRVVTGLRTRMAMVLALLASMFGATPAMAFTTPAAGDFGYDAYDIVINKMISGPIGWVGAAILVAWGISNIMKQWIIFVGCIIGATCIIKIQTILTSVGAVIN